MHKDSLRFTTRIYRSHPLFDLLEGDRRGGQMLLDFATAWYAYQLGQRQESAEGALVTGKDESPLPTLKDSEQPVIDGRLLDDALT